MGPQNKVPIDLLFLSIYMFSEQTRVHFDKLSCLYHLVYVLSYFYFFYYFFLTTHH